MRIPKDKIILGGKCLPVIDELKYLKNKGCSYFEAFTNYNYIKDFNSSELKSITKDMSMYCIHTPMHFLNEDLALGDGGASLNAANMTIVKKTLDIANEYSNVDEPVVVVHLGIPRTLDKLEVSDSEIREYRHIQKLAATAQMYEISNYIVSKNYRTVVSVENVPFLVSSNENIITPDTQQWVFGNELDVIDFLDDNRFASTGSCIDLCHAQMDLIHYEKYKVKTALSLDRYIDRFADSVKLVHFNRANNLGFASDHSRTYEGYDKLHNEIVSKMLNKGYNKAPWTIEVTEDFSNKDTMYCNYEVARDMLVKEINLINPNLEIIY